MVFQYILGNLSTIFGDFVTVCGPCHHLQGFCHYFREVGTICRDQNTLILKVLAIMATGALE